MFVCISVCTYVQAGMQMYTCVSASMDICFCASVHACVEGMCVFVSVHVSMQVRGREPTFSAGSFTAASLVGLMNDTVLWGEV